MWLSGGASSGIGGWGVASVGESAGGVVGSVARLSSGLAAADGEVGEVAVGDIVLWGLVGDRRWRFCAGEEFEGRRVVGIFLGWSVMRLVIGLLTHAADLRKRWWSAIAVWMGRKREFWT